MPRMEDTAIDVLNQMGKQALVRLVVELQEDVATAREKLAAFMIRNGFATGHGETFDDLLKELEWQVKERSATLRSAVMNCFIAGSADEI